MVLRFMSISTFMSLNHHLPNLYLCPWPSSVHRNPGVLTFWACHPFAFSRMCSNPTLKTLFKISPTSTISDPISLWQATITPASMMAQAPKPCSFFFFFFLINYFFHLFYILTTVPPLLPPPQHAPSIPHCFCSDGQGSHACQQSRAYQVEVGLSSSLALSFASHNLFSR